MSWNQKPVRAGRRTRTGCIVDPFTAAEYSRLTGLIAASRHPAARAWLVDQRARLLRKLR